MKAYKYAAKTGTFRRNTRIYPQINLAANHLFHLIFNGLDS
ncbi:MAG: hypothetical protein JWP78_971 [Mucilaginibacter sp.]|nr:hypothetical protein [Mucilaginibacter sp.]